MPVVGAASLLVRPSFEGFQSEAAKQAGKAGPGIGSRLASGVGAGLKRGAQVAGVAAGAVLSVAIAKGFQRLTAIEEAEAKLRGLGHSAEGVEKIMKDALASVKGTAFGMGEAATTASGAVAAGIKPGQELEKYLKLTADAATIAGVSMEEMGSIINKTTTSGKVYSDNLNQLADRGIPIFQWLQKEYGVSADEFSTMVRKGQVDAETFRKVIEENIGGAALESGTTTQGALKNLGASLGRIGANVMGGAFAHLPRLFSGITDALSPLEGQAKNVGQAIGDYLGVAVDWLLGKLPSIIDWLSNAGNSLKSMFAALKSGGISEMFASMSSGGDGLLRSLQGILPALGSFAATLPGLASAVLDLASRGLQFLSDHMDKIIRFLPAIIAGFTLYRTASAGAAVASQSLQAAQLALLPVTLANNVARMLAASAETRLAIATGASTAATLRSTAATVAQRVATIAASVAARAAAAAQWLLNAALSANPIGLIVLAIAALVAGLVWFFTQTEIGQKIVTVAWAAIKTAAQVVVNWFVNTALPWLQQVWAGIAAGAKFMWDSVIKPTFAALVAGFQAVGQWVSNVWTTWIKPVFELIGAIIKWLWNNVALPYFASLRTGFQQIGTFFQTVWTSYLKPVFELLGAIVKWLWDNVAKPYFASLKTGFSELGSAFKGVWDNTLKPMFNAVGAIIKWLWDNVGSPYFTSLKAGWDAMVRGIKSLWDNTLKPMFDRFGETVGKIKGWFDTAVKGVKTAWDKLEGIAKKPIKFVIDTVLNKGLIGNFNKIAGVLGTTKLPAVSVGFFRGGPTPNVGDRNIAGVVHGNEHVATAEEVRRTPGGHRTWAMLRAAAMSGRLGAILGNGYLAGGQVILPNSTWRRHTSGYRWPYAGDGNAPNDMGKPFYSLFDGVVAWVKHMTTSYGRHLLVNYADGKGSGLYAHASKIIVRAGQMVRRGQQLGNIGSTGNSTGPHMHYEQRTGHASIGSGGPGGDAGEALPLWAQGLANKIGGLASGVWDKISTGASGFRDWLGSKFDLSKIPGAKILTDMVKVLPGRIMDGLVGFIRDKLPGFARGTTSAPRGLAMVGELGPELVNFRGGERVYNAHETARMAAASGGSLDALSADQIAAAMEGVNFNLYIDGRAAHAVVTAGRKAGES